MINLFVAFVVAVVSSFMAGQIFHHEFGDRISLDDQQRFASMYIKTIQRRRSLLFIFDCRSVAHVDPAAIWEHIRVFHSLRQLNRRKVASFSILMQSNRLSAVLNMVFQMVPPSAPYLVTDDPRKAISHACRYWSTIGELSPEECFEWP